MALTVEEYFQKGIEKYKQGLLEEALADFDKAIELDPNDADGKSETFDVLHSYNAQQIEWVQAGSALNKIRKDFG